MKNPRSIVLRHLITTVLLWDIEFSSLLTETGHLSFKDLKYSKCKSLLLFTSAPSKFYFFWSTKVVCDSPGWAQLSDNRGALVNNEAKILVLHMLEADDARMTRRAQNQQKHSKNTMVTLDDLRQ